MWILDADSLNQYLRKIYFVLKILLTQSVGMIEVLMRQNGIKKLEESKKLFEEARALDSFLSKEKKQFHYQKNWKNVR